MAIAMPKFINGGLGQGQPTPETPANDPYHRPADPITDEPGLALLEIVAVLKPLPQKDQALIIAYMTARFGLIPYLNTLLDEMAGKHTSASEHDKTDV